MIQTDMTRPLPKRPRGFTMLELLVVIGVILILISMMFIGLKYVSNQGRTKDTKQAMEIARTLLANYENATQLRPPPQGIYNQPSGYPYSAQQFATTFWTYQFPLQQGTVTTNYQSTYNVIIGDTGQGLADAGDNNLVERTMIAMQLFMSIPDNVTLLNSLPQGKKVMVTFNSSSLVTPTTSVTVPILLDGWGNPIYFVPGGGISNVVFKSDPPPVTTGGPPTWHVVSSSGAHASPYTQNASDRPFFMSGGPDDDVSRGDDNIYSFEN
jgi:prepilin-type N-terminal cleavage/methylation domain-containing protein